MSDGDIKKEGVPVKGEAEIRALPILRASLWHRLEARLAKKGNKERKKRSVASINGEAAKTGASQRVIRREIGATAARGGRKGGRKVLETEASSKAEVVIGEDKLRARGDSREPG